MSVDPVLVQCVSCGVVNRLRLVGDSFKAVCGRCKTELEPLKKPVRGTVSNFEKEVLGWPGLVLVDFWAEWCGPCRSIAPVLEQLARDRSGRLKIVKVDTEQEPELAAQFGVRSIPTLILFRNGKAVDQLAGALPKAELERWVDTSAALVV